MLTVYVAGSSAHWERTRAFIERCNDHEALRVTFDWTLDVAEARARGEVDSDLANGERYRLACHDLYALSRADVVVVLADAGLTSRGLWVELGYALALRDQDKLRAIIVSGGERRSIFSTMPLVDFEVPYAVGEHDAEAFALLVDLADELARDHAESESCGSRVGVESESAAASAP